MKPHAHPSEQLRRRWRWALTLEQPFNALLGALTALLLAAAVEAAVTEPWGRVGLAAAVLGFITAAWLVVRWRWSRHRRTKGTLFIVHAQSSDLGAEAARAQLAPVEVQYLRTQVVHRALPARVSEWPALLDQLVEDVRFVVQHDDQATGTGMAIDAPWPIALALGYRLATEHANELANMLVWARNQRGTAPADVFTIGHLAMVAAAPLPAEGSGDHAVLLVALTGAFTGDEPDGVTIRSGPGSLRPEEFAGMAVSLADHTSRLLDPPGNSPLEVYARVENSIALGWGVVLGARGVPPGRLRLMWRLPTGRYEALPGFTSGQQLNATAQGTTHGHRLVNLTPHAVTILGPASTVLPPSALAARLIDVERSTGTIAGGHIAVTEVGIGPAEGLPLPEAGTFFVVPRLLATARPDRRDLLFPYQEVRDAQGRVVACRSLGRVPAPPGTEVSDADPVARAPGD